MKTTAVIGNSITLLDRGSFQLPNTVFSYNCHDWLCVYFFVFVFLFFFLLLVMTNCISDNHDKQISRFNETFYLFEKFFFKCLKKISFCHLDVVIC